MKKLQAAIILSIMIVLTGCFSDEKSSLAKQENIKAIVKKIQNTFPEDTPILNISLFSCGALEKKFCNAFITYKRANKYYDIYYDGTWADPKEIRKIQSRKYKNTKAKKIIDFTFDNVVESYKKVYEQLQKKYNNNIDKHILSEISQEVDKKGNLVLKLTINVSKKDDKIQQRYEYKRLNGLGDKRRCLVSKIKYYPVYVSVNKDGSFQKNVNLSKGSIYEQTSL